MNTLPVVDAEVRARQLLRETPAVAALADARFARIVAGSSHHAWCVIAATGERRFVRLAAAASRGLGADLQAEAGVLALVAAAGLAPRPLHDDPLHGLLVTEWIDVAARPQPPGPAQLQAVADCVARLHALPAPAGLRAVDFERQAAVLRGSAAGADDALAARAQDVFGGLGDRAGDTCLCHNDLNPANVLADGDGRLWLVDWEYAGIGDPAFDLASYASQHRLDESSCSALLAAYRDRGGRVDAHGLRLAGWAFDYVQALWYRALAAAPGDAPLDAAAALDQAVRLENSLRHRATDAGRSDNASFDS